VTPAAFLELYAEFQALYEEDPGLIVAALARAERRISDTWGSRRDDAVALTAAHQLALSPWGRNARLSEPGKTTVYQAELDTWKKGHACARSRAVSDP
jgi:hypothetical protein